MNSTIFDISAPVVPNLNFLESIWSAWYNYVQNDTLATGLAFFCLHEAAYFGRCLIWLTLDNVPYFARYKIQEKVPTAEQQWKCTKYVLFTHFVVELPTMYFFHPIMHAIGISVAVPFPSLWLVIIQCLIFLVFEDTWHYFGHRLLHHPYFYKRIHKHHHEFSAPFGLAASYAHPAEIMFLGMGTVVPPIMASLLTAGNVHMITVFIWAVLRIFQAVDAHSGYDLPWSLHNWIPIWAGAAWHDKHHEHFIGNYSSSFKWWDIIMETKSADMRRLRDARRQDLQNSKLALVEDKPLSGLIPGTEKADLMLVVSGIKGEKEQSEGTVQ